MKFSLLISVYAKENALFFNEALESLFNQTVRANEVVLVEDGPLTQELYDVIEKWRDKLNIQRVKLEHNIGLGLALQEGLHKCQYNIVARMDSDDISLKNRFELQINHFKENPNIDVLGGFISEFETDSSIVSGLRKVPLIHEEIVKYGQTRNPMNHVTVMFNKKSVLSVEGYKSVIGFEDYYLWARMLNNNAQFANLSEILVNVRGGNAMVARRQGFKYAMTEFKFQKKLLNIRFLSFSSFVKNIIFRMPVRMCPGFVIKMFYKLFLRR